MRGELKDILAEPRMVCSCSLSLSAMFDNAQSSFRLASMFGSHSLSISQANNETHNGPDHLVVNNPTRGQLKFSTETHKNIAFVPSSSSLASSEGRPKADRESEFMWFIQRHLKVILTMSFGARTSKKILLSSCMYWIIIIYMPCYQRYSFTKVSGESES